MLEAEYSETGAVERVERSKAISRPAAQRQAPARPAAEDRAKKEAPAPKPPEKPAEKSDAEAKKPAFWRRRPLTTLGILILAGIAAFAGYLWWDNASHFESTDDAFIAARQIAIAPQVTGYVVSVPVTDNQYVKAGDVIAKLDDRDYVAALDQANAQVASANASIANVEAQQDVQAAQIQSAKAQVAQAKAALAFAEQQAARYQNLAKTGAGTVQNAQQYSSQLDQQKAAVTSTEAAEHVAERQLAALQAQLLSAEASLKSAEAQREQALLNVGYTTVKASEPGWIVNLTAAPGEFAQPGTDLTMFVPDDLWITANYKETQLDQMRPGQPVTFTIDAYPERELKGRVASVQPGSGTAFSLLPAQNATGNYVKVVQRVPVKILFDKAPPDVALGPGMSVVPTVRVDPSPSLYERLARDARPYWSKL